MAASASGARSDCADVKRSVWDEWSLKSPSWARVHVTEMRKPVGADL